MQAQDNGAASSHNANDAKDDFSGSPSLGPLTVTHRLVPAAMLGASGKGHRPNFVSSSDRGKNGYVSNSSTHNSGRYNNHGSGKAADNGWPPRSKVHTYGNGSRNNHGESNNTGLDDVGNGSLNRGGGGGGGQTPNSSRGPTPSSTPPISSTSLAITNSGGVSHHDGSLAGLPTSTAVSGDPAVAAVTMPLHSSSLLPSSTTAAVPSASIATVPSSPPASGLRSSRALNSPYTRPSSLASSQLSPTATPFVPSFDPSAFSPMIQPAGLHQLPPPFSSAANAPHFHPSQTSQPSPHARSLTFLFIGASSASLPGGAGSNRNSINGGTAASPSLGLASPPHRAVPLASEGPLHGHGISDMVSGRDVSAVSSSNSLPPLSTSTVSASRSAPNTPGLQLVPSASAALSASASSHAHPSTSSSPGLGLAVHQLGTPLAPSTSSYSNSSQDPSPSVPSAEFTHSGPLSATVEQRSHHHHHPSSHHSLQHGQGYPPRRSMSSSTLAPGSGASSSYSSSSLPGAAPPVGDTDREYASSHGRWPPTQSHPASSTPLVIPTSTPTPSSLSSTFSRTGGLEEDVTGMAAALGTSTSTPTTIASPATSPIPTPTSTSSMSTSSAASAGTAGSASGGANPYIIAKPPAHWEVDPPKPRTRTRTRAHSAVVTSVDGAPAAADEDHEAKLGGDGDSNTSNPAAALTTTGAAAKTEVAANIHPDTNEDADADADADSDAPEEVDEWGSELEYKLDYLVVLDVEATCDASSDGSAPVVTRDNQEVIEFPWVVVDLATLEVTDKQQLFVQPQWTRITPFCSSLTGITQADVDHAPTLQVVLARFEEYLQKTFVARNKSFCVVTDGEWDCKVQILGETILKQLPRPKPCMRFINIQTLFAEFYARFCVKRKPNLRYMLSFLNLPVAGRHHSGIDDCASIASIVLKMCQDGFVFRKKHVRALTTRSYSCLALPFQCAAWYCCLSCIMP